jgi:hypothetical protein
MGSTAAWMRDDPIREAADENFLIFHAIDEMARRLNPASIRARLYSIRPGSRRDVWHERVFEDAEHCDLHVRRLDLRLQGTERRLDLPLAWIYALAFIPRHAQRKPQVSKTHRFRNVLGQIGNDSSRLGYRYMSISP